ncbi:unnamed protein product [Strongylus vulgaris]|uniref:PurM-like N-terminal domain-containing protein n=1 Tax=Strongylus vulgaris TaxID=40348 RepID=A0A3P7J6P7_STRVU|nr:unnamed protein product [Strongylus vulgaris]
MTESERIERILKGFDPVLLELLKTFDTSFVIDGEGVGIGLDSCVVPLRHKGLNLVQTTDFFYPLIDDPYLMGRVTCANVLSDLYAMGVVNCDNMLMLLGVAVDLNEKERNVIVSMFIEGFKTVRCPWLLLGGVATSVASDKEIIMVDRAGPGDVLVLTKPLGGQKNGRVEEYGLDEKKIIRAFQQVTEQMTRLNRNAAKMLHKFSAHASTDVTGFGILVIEYMDEIARKMPNGNGFNLFGGTAAETSGGLLVALSPENAEGFINGMKSADGFPAWIVGRVEKLEEGTSHAVIDKEFKVVSVPSAIHN